MTKNLDTVEEISGWAFGLRIHGTLPSRFRSSLVPGPEDPVNSRHDVTVTYHTIDTLPEGDEFWVAEPQEPITRGRFALLRLDGDLALSVKAEGTGIFRLGPDQIAIEWLPPEAPVAHYFFCYALPLWLETKGSPMLHASAVMIGGRVVAFLGQSGVGKSTLCAELMRSGCEFVADDGLALSANEGGQLRCFLGPPQLRLWPSTLETRLEIAAAELRRVHDTLDKRQLPIRPSPSAASAGLELAAIYVLDRRPGPGGTVEITPSSPQQSLLRLIEHSVAGGPASAIGLGPKRLDRLAKVVERVPVRRLGFPSDIDSTRRIRDAIMNDIADTNPGT